MNQTTSARQVAWGLELGATQAVLVRLEIHEGQTVVREPQRLDLPANWQSGQFGTALIAALTRLVPGEKLGICFPDRAMLCRGLSIPRTEPALMEKMIAAQAEGFLSGGAGGSGGNGGNGGSGGGSGGLEWTTSSFADPADPGKQWVLFCAARREMLGAIRRALPAGVELKALLPRALAAAGAGATNGAAAAPQVLVDLTDEALTLSLAVGPRVLRCLVLEAEDEPGAAHANGTAWVMPARRGLDALVDGLSPAARPRTGVLRTGNGDGAALAAALSGAFGLTVTTLAAPQMPSVAGDADAAGYSGAIGAAQLALRSTADGAINFALLPRDESAGPTRRPLRVRRLIALAVICVAAVAALYFIDRYRAHMLTVEVDSLRQAEKTTGGVAQRLAVGQYLEKNASPALATLDAVLSAAPPSVQLVSFGITNSGSQGTNTASMAGAMPSSGQFHLTVTLGGPPEVTSFVGKLEKSPTLTHIQMGSVRSNQGKWTLELTGDIAAAAGMPAAPATKPATKPAAGTGAATKPAAVAGAAAAVPATRGAATTMPAIATRTRSDDAAARKELPPATTESARRAQP